LNINCFSGGTEVTSFHRNTIKSLQKTGFIFQLEDFSHQNPKYLISFKDTSKSILGFSKRYDDSINKTPFIAITTCERAHIKCTHILEATAQFHLPFEDPKASDYSDLKDKTYSKLNNQIAAEIFFIFSEVHKKCS